MFLKNNYRDMDDRGFYCVLPSNVQPDFHKDNTASSFQTTFPNSYNLTGEWEVALTEVSYVNTIPTIVNEHFTINSSKLDSDAKTYLFDVHNFFLIQDKPKTKKKKWEQELNLPEYPDLADLTSKKTFHKFRAKSKDCPFSIRYIKSLDRYIIKAEKEDIPPNIYMYKREAELLKFTYPDARVIEDGKYIQLWRETLKKGSTYSSRADPSWLGAAETIGLKVMSTECLTISIPKGFYPTAEKLVEALNREMKHPLADWDKSVQSGGKTACGYRFAYNSGENRIMLGLTEYTDITFHENLHQILGFENRRYRGGQFTAKHAPLMTQGIYHIYIYCDLCSPIRVGNMLVPLLRTIEVPSSKDWGRVSCIRFQRPMYIPIAKSSFNSIKVELYDDTGRSITFSEGRTVVTLHFRPRHL
mgnify:CR=1 FL=1